MVMNRTTASRLGWIMAPSVQTMPIGMMAIAHVCTKFDKGVGFSYG